MSSHRGLDAQALDTLTARTRPAGRSFSLTLTERPHLPRSARLPRPHPRGVLNPPRRCEMPTSARRAEVGALRAAKTTPGVRARDGSQRQEGVLAVGVRDLRAAEHDDVLRLVALGELTSRPVRGSRLKTISHESLEGSLRGHNNRGRPLMPLLVTGRVKARPRGPPSYGHPLSAWATPHPRTGGNGRTVKQAPARRVDLVHDVPKPSQERRYGPKSLRCVRHSVGVRFRPARRQAASARCPGSRSHTCTPRSSVTARDSPS